MKNPALILLLLGPLIWLQAQDDVTKDHPLFSRVEGFDLHDHIVQDFAAYQFCDEEGDHYVVEGQLSYYYYESEGSIDPRKILKKFSDIGNEAGASVYGDGENQLYLVMKEGKKVIYVDLFAEDFYYTLNIIERGDLKTEITADALLVDLMDIGKAVLFFNFKRQECVITDECKPIIEMIATVLRMEPSINIRIDAYTDNIGRSDVNQELSVNRATMLGTALIGLGIEPGRIECRGFGEESPIADNSTVMGRAFNNRIELVRK